MSLRRHHDTGDPTHMLHRILEKYQVHLCIILIVLLQGIIDMCLQVIVMDLVILLITRYSLGEVAENQILRIFLLEILGKVVLSECLLDDITHELLIRGNVLISDQSITI